MNRISCFDNNGVVQLEATACDSQIATRAASALFGALPELAVTNDPCNGDPVERLVPMPGANANRELQPQPIRTTPDIPYPRVKDGKDGRIVFIDGVHRMADQMQRQGACIVQHETSGELFVVIQYTDGSTRRWA